MNFEETTVVDAERRMTKCEFEAGKDAETYPSSIYTCPVCNEHVTFAMSDFERHALSEVTNLTPEDANDLGVASQAYSLKVFRSVNFRSFIDFYCRGCRSAVRIYYVPWGGGRYTHGYKLAFVVEKRPSQLKSLDRRVTRS